jgi:hypothetical protein
MLGESISVAEKIKNSALQSISWAIDTRDAEKGYPIILFNTLPYECERTVTINQIRNKVYGITDEDGAVIPMQYVHAETERTYGREDVIFTAKIPAMGYSIYYIKGETKEYESTVKATDTTLENKNLLVEFEKHTGYITRIYDKVAEKELLSGSEDPFTPVSEDGDTVSSGAGSAETPIPDSIDDNLEKPDEAAFAEARDSEQDFLSERTIILEKGESIMDSIRKLSSEASDEDDDFLSMLDSVSKENDKSSSSSTDEFDVVYDGKK